MLRLKAIAYGIIEIKTGLLLLLSVSMIHCAKEDSTGSLPFILLDQGEEFNNDGDFIPVGGQMKFGISVVGGGSAVTNLRVKRISSQASVTELDKGLYVAEGGIDTTLVYVKSDAEQETWNFFIMNARRDTASISITIFKGDGSAYGEIFHYPSITLGYPGNSQYQHFLDLNSGIAYQEETVAGHEDEIDLAAFFYYSSGKSSPTLTCPAYPSAMTYYPVFGDWALKNSTLYDYKTSDNDLVSPAQFEAAMNDSLLVAGYLPQNVSGLCKFCYTGKVIPFKTAQGKYGMVRVIRADEQENGSMEIAVKIQK
jgi:hypothetical protein